MTGLRAWILQRMTALYMGIYLLVLAVGLLSVPMQNFTAWRRFFSHPLMGTATLLFFAALLVHSWVGVRDVVLDYARPAALRLAMLALLGLWLVSMGIWVARILLLMAS